MFVPDPYAGVGPGSAMVDPWQNYMAAAAPGHAAYYSAGAAAAAAGRLNQVQSFSVIETLLHPDKLSQLANVTKTDDFTPAR